MGMKMNSQTCKYLFEIVGSNVRDIQSELEKLNLRFHKQTIGVDQIKEMAIHGRIYNVFELMDAISARDGKSATLILSRILDEEDERSSALKIMGMLNRQIRNLWKAMGVNRSGGKKGELSRITGLTNYYAEKLLHLSRKWTETELESAMALLYEADQLLKSGNRPRPVLEDLILALAFSGGGS
jgi:DNA polymerase-3 subunit delta